MWVSDHPIEILETLRTVNKSDFYNKKGNKIYPEEFYILSESRNVIEYHKPHPNYKWEKWREHIRQKLMYVKK